MCDDEMEIRKGLKDFNIATVDNEVVDVSIKDDNVYIADNYFKK